MYSLVVKEDEQGEVLSGGGVQSEACMSSAKQGSRNNGNSPAGPFPASKRRDKENQPAAAADGTKDR